MERYQVKLTAGASFTGSKINEEMGDYQICFMGQICGFDRVTIGKGKGLYSGTEVEITPSQIQVFNAIDHSLAAAYEVELAAADYLGIVIRADLKGTALLEVSSGKSRIVLENIPWNGRMGSIFLETGEKTEVVEGTFTYYANGWKKPIWLFGDSYLNLTSPARWTSYLTSKGIDSVMLNGFPGRNSQTALKALETAMEHGTPRELIWCLGMNDGDSSEGVNASWQEVYEKVDQICREKKIELVLSTIPSCKVNNHFKNAIVRESGYRFIDFEKAVGAHVFPFWYDGMIEEGPDKVHPSEYGAVALYHQAVTDCPELLSSLA